MQQTLVRFWPHEENNDCMTVYSADVLLQKCVGDSLDQLSKQSKLSNILFSDGDSIRTLSLKRKTNRLKTNTLLKRRVSCTVGRNFKIV